MSLVLFREIVSDLPDDGLIKGRYMQQSEDKNNKKSVLH
jgi:hypothetical protein